MRHLEFFERWPENKKFLVKFEDILEKPFEVIDKLAKFLDAPEDRVQELISNYKSFSEKVFLSYKRQMGTENIQLEKCFHRKKFPKSVVESLGIRLKKMNPYLFNKYLKCYEG